MPQRIRAESRAGRRLALWVLLLTASACGTPSPAPPVSEKPAEKPAPAPAITVETLPSSEEAPPPVKPSPPATQPKQAAAVPAKPEPVNDDPRQLLAMSGKGVAQLLGPASFVRRDGPAEVWQYRAEHCVLDVFLYKENSALSVAHIDLRQRRRSTLPTRECFAGLLAAQSG